LHRSVEKRRCRKEVISMDEPLKEVRETTIHSGNTTQTNQQVFKPARKRSNGQTIAARVIWYIAGVLLVLLALRFFFVLLAANPANSVAKFVFNASHPFVAPFFSLFGYSIHYGVSKFETFTLVAMVIYALIAFGLARLVTITKE